MTLLELREFFFWNMVLNACLLLFSFVMIMGVRKIAYRIHGAMFNLSDDQLNVIWYSTMAAYKIVVFVFNVVPYVALRIMTG